MGWKDERFIYGIFTLDENKKITGVYVGSANEIKLRIDSHLSSKNDNPNQKELHEIMRTGAFIVRELQKVNYENRWREYEWIRFFRDYTDYRIFNTFTNFHMDKDSDSHLSSKE